MISKKTIEENGAIIFRMGASIDPEQNRIIYHTLSRYYHKSSAKSLCSELLNLLPYRISMELLQIRDFIVTKYPNSIVLPASYGYFGPYPIQFNSLDHQVSGWVMTTSEPKNEKDTTCLLSRGNIFILNASKLVWRELSKQDITSKNLKFTKFVS